MVGLHNRLDSRTQDILGSMPDAIVVISAAGRILFVTPKGEALFGYSRAELVGQPVGLLVPKEAARATHEACRAAASGSPAGRVMGTRQYLQARRKDGRSIPVDISLSSLTLEGVEVVVAAVRDATLRKQTEEELRREAVERAALAEIGRVISGSLDIDEVYARFAGIVRRLIPFDRLTIVATDRDAGINIDLHVAGMHIPGWEEKGIHPMAGTLTEAVIEARRPVVVSDQLARRSAGRPGLSANIKAGIRSVLGVPLIASGEVLGSLNFRSKTRNAYSARDIALAERVADQIAGAIASSQLYENTLRESHEREVLAEIGRIVSSSPEIGAVYDGFAAQVRRLLPYDRLSISTVNSDRTFSTRYFSGVAFDGEASETHIPLPGSLTGEIARSRSPTLVELEDQGEVLKRYPGLVHAYRAGLRSLIAVPLTLRGRAIGALFVAARQSQAYDDRDVAAAQRVATQIVGAVESSALYREVARVAAIAEAAIDGIITFDEHGHIGSINPAAQRLFGYSGSEIVGKHIAMLMPEPYRAEYASHIRNHLPRGNPKTIGVVRELRGLRKDGTEFPIELSVSEASADGARIFVGITRDVAERKRAEAAEAEKRELQRIDTERSQFVSSVSHELKTPLTSITAFTDILRRNREGNLSPRQISQLGVMQRNGKRLAGLIDDMLDVSRLTAGAFKLRRREFEVGPWLRELADSFEPILAQKGQTLVRDLPDARVWLNADRDRLAQVAANLISNASKYSPDGRSIELAGSVTGEVLHISIRDHGIGISEEDLPRLFSVFFRADNEATSAAGGTGLGLAIAKGIVELHGGRISLDSRLDQGTAVRFTVPGIVNAPPKN